MPQCYEYARKLSSHLEGLQLRQPYLLFRQIISGLTPTKDKLDAKDKTRTEIT